MKLTDKDFELLFKKEAFPIGESVLMLEPLPMEKISEAAAIYALVRDKLKSAGKTFDASDAAALAEYAPGLLALASGLDESDIRRLPAGVAAALAMKLIEINIASHESLLKNFLKLAKEVTEAIRSGLGTPSNSLSNRGIRSQK